MDKLTIALPSIINNKISVAKKLNSNTAHYLVRQRFRLFQGILPLKRANIGSDIIAGIVLAAIGIPEVMGYTKIAGTPVSTGLYTLLVPVLVFAVLGSSRHLVVAADSATAAILAAGLSKFAPLYTPQYLGLTELVAILVAVMLLIARLFKLGFIADFLSRTVLIGFLTGVGIQVAISQLPGLLDLKSGGRNPIEQITSAIAGLADANPLAIAISISTLATIVLCKRFLPKFPGALLAVVVAIIASWQFDFASLGVTVVGTVPSGLPPFSLPQVSLAQVPQVLGIAFSCCIVIIAQSAATSRAYAFRYSENFKENFDLEGLAVANLAAGLTGTFVVNGSPTKTEIVDTAGGRSQIAQLSTVVIVLIVILFLTKPVSYLPNTVLAAIVFTIGLKLIDIPGMRGIFKTHREEFYLAVVTTATVVLIGVEQGILLAILLSLVLHVRHSYRPHSAIIVPGENNFWQPIPAKMGSISAPGLIIYRFSRDLFYANASFFSEEVQNLVKSADPPLRWFILEARAITEIDYSASQTIRDIVLELASQKVTFVVSGLAPEVKAQCDLDGLTDLIDSDRFFDHLDTALAAFYQKPNSN